VVEDEFSAEEVSYSLTVVSANAVNNADEICENLIETTNDFQNGVGVYVDGQLVTVCENEQSTKAAMEQVVAKYSKKSERDSISFTNKIEYVGGLYPVAKIASSDSVTALNEALTVMNTTAETTTETIPFTTKEVKDDDYYIGYRQVKTQGKNGEKEITANVSYVDGKEVSRTVISEEITKEPTDKIIIVGSKRYSSASKDDDTSNLFWPVENTNVSNISSYFGDGRNHKGTDILAPNGTAIFAAEAGTVTYVGWESGYGYYMEIDHGNGLSTLYSHCSSISAVQGQKVSRGDYIAAVGITGRASAYHLHFEVQIHGSAVDARPYLGVN
jgi:murein DD-endopeptidase MepM/ murein hydrolase activator NlpD